MTTRWVLSYMRGPLMREQIRGLMAKYKAAAAETHLPPSAPVVSAGIADASTVQSIQQTAAQPGPAQVAAGTPPALPPEIAQYYIPIRGRAPAGCRLVYFPRLFGACRVGFADSKTRVNVVKPLQFLAEITGGPIPVDWEQAEMVEVAAADLEKRPDAGVTFAELPSVAGQARSYVSWTRELTNWLYGSQRLELFKSPGQGLASKPGEDERDFRLRLGQSAREQRDDAVDALRKKYAPKLATLQERLRRSQQALDREKEQARQSGVQAAISIGATLLGAFTGRKGLSGATTAARGVGRSMNQHGDVGRAEDTVEAVQKQLKALQEQFDGESAELAARVDPATEELHTLAIKPKKADIAVQLVALAWAPYWEDDRGGVEQAF